MRITESDWSVFIDHTFISNIGNSFRLVGTAYVSPNGEVDVSEVHALKVSDELVPDYPLDTKFRLPHGDGVMLTLKDIAEREAMFMSGRFPDMRRCEVTDIACEDTDLVSLDNGVDVIDLIAVDAYDEDTRTCTVLKDEAYECEGCGTVYLRGVHCEDCECVDIHGDWQLVSDCEWHEDLRGYSEGYILSRELECEWHWCDSCEEYVDSDDWNYEQHCCCDCSCDGVILGYHAHHRTTPRFFGKAGSKDYIGIELEISGNPNSDYPTCRYNQEFAEGLAYEAGLEEDEIWFEEDCSIGDGFEIISAPHTVEDFFDKTDKWAKMLKACSDAGFKSHDARCCGLHVHVNRLMLGKDEKAQNLAIGKIAKFFDLRWDELVKASRRRSFDFCEKPRLRGRKAKEGTEAYRHEESSKCEKGDPLNKWVDAAKRVSGHGAALNNGNSATFEFRLGRGTLNPLSFFAWIDLVVNIAKNAKKGDKRLEDDAKEWLSGIKLTTALYLWKRGAFRTEVEAMFPEASWVDDATDQSESA